jgi:hypothetical protein
MSEDRFFSFGFALGFVLVFLFSWAVTDGLMDYYRSKAVLGGIAEYKVNVMTGETTFTWKDEEAKK